MLFIDFFFFFFFTHTATTEIYTLSLHDALPISGFRGWLFTLVRNLLRDFLDRPLSVPQGSGDSRVHHLLESQRSEEHTSELQSPMYLVCRLLLEKKKKRKSQLHMSTVIHSRIDH